MNNPIRTAYNKLESDIINALSSKLEKSGDVSKHMIGIPCIKVEILNYTEMVFIDGKLGFFDDRGYHYSLHCERYIEELINLLDN